MKNIYTIVMLLFSITKGLSQEKNDTLSINFIKAPSSPAANILGFSPSEIQSPTDPSALMASFQNSTSNFTALPKSFAIDIAPFWFFSGRSRTYKEYTSDKAIDNIKQSLILSIAYRDSSNALKGYKNNSLIGFGGKISLLRGKSTSIEYFYKKAKQLDSLIQKEVDGNKELEDLNNKADDIVINNDGKETDESIKIRDKATKLEEAIKTKILKEFNAVKANIESKEQVRNGFKWDLAGGYSYRYPQNNTDSSLAFRGGAWTTFGYDWANKSNDGQFSFLCMLRYLKNPAQAWADDKGVLAGKTDVSTLDYGIKTSFIKSGKHATTVNVELLYRSIISKQDVKSKIESSIRMAFNANYEVSKNVVLSLAVGRDFDGYVTKNGNVFAFLNLITAFGAGTKINNE